MVKCKTETSTGLHAHKGKIISLTVYAMLLLSAFIPSAVIWAYLRGRALPWWHDGGNWLKHMHAIFGETAPMWEEGVWQYPPLYFLFLAGAQKLVGDEVLALKLTALVAFSLRPITTYMLGKKLLGGRLPALGAAWLASVPPVAVEMIGWGGYPNLLGFTILPVVFYSILNLTEQTTFKNLIIALILALVTTLTHHLTFLVFVGTMALWVLALGFMRLKREFAAVGSTLIFTLVVFIAYRLTFAWPNQFVLFNEAAYHHLTLAANPGIIMWIFKDGLLLFLLFLTAFLSIILSVQEDVEKEKLALLVAWVVTPILMSQGHLLGVTMDYPRIFIFTVQPLLILAAMPLSLLDKFVSDGSNLLHNLKEDMSLFLRSVKRGRFNGQEKVSGKRLLVTTLVIITLIATSMNLALGIRTVRAVELWYRGIDYYGDEEKLEASRWILENTSPEDVFVAEEKIGRWIEGLAGRPVLLYEQPMFLFMKGEAERAYAARSIYTSNYGIANGFTWVFDQTPHGVFSPTVAFYHKGDYEGLLYLDVNSSQIEWDSKDGTVCRDTLLNASRIEVEWVERSAEQTTLLTRYLMRDLIVERAVCVERAKPCVKFSFTVTSVQESIKSLSLTICLNQIDGRTFWDGPEKLLNKTIRLLTDIGPMDIRSTAESVFPFVFDQDKKGVGLVFSGDKDREILYGDIEVGPADPEGAAKAVESYEREEVMVKYGVGYVVLPRVFLEEWGKEFSLETETLPIYTHLLKDKTLLIAYENKRMIILKMGSSKS